MGCKTTGAKGMQDHGRKRDASPRAQKGCKPVQPIRSVNPGSTKGRKPARPERGVSPRGPKGAVHAVSPDCLSHLLTTNPLNVQAIVSKMHYYARIC